MTNFPQTVAGQLVQLYRSGADRGALLGAAAEQLTVLLNAEHCVIWLAVGDRLAAVCEFSVDGTQLRGGTSLDSRTSMEVVLGFLQEPTNADGDVIRFDTEQGHLQATMQSKGTFRGYVEIFGARQSVSDSPAASQFADAVRVLANYLQADFDLRLVAMDIWNIKLLYDLTRLFSPFEAFTEDAKKWTEVSKMLSSRFGFENCAIYFLESSEKSVAENDLILRAKALGEADRKAFAAPDRISWAEVENPILKTVQNGAFKFAGSVHHPHLNLLPADFFASELAMLVPIVPENGQAKDCCGVIVLWQRPAEQGEVIIQIRDFASVIAAHLAAFK